MHACNYAFVTQSRGRDVDYLDLDPENKVQLVYYIRDNVCHHKPNKKSGLVGKISGRIVVCLAK